MLVQRATRTYCRSVRFQSVLPRRHGSIIDNQTSWYTASHPWCIIVFGCIVIKYYKKYTHQCAAVDVLRSGAEHDRLRGGWKTIKNRECMTIYYRNLYYYNIILSGTNICLFMYTNVDVPAGLYGKRYDKMMTIIVSETSCRRGPPVLFAQ